MGGGPGIGPPFVEASLNQGGQVVFLDIQDEASQALAASLAGEKHAPKYIRCDLTNLDAAPSVFAQIDKHEGATQILVNNAANDNRPNVEDVIAKD